ncbi:MAG: hypothetical protein MMC23_002077 [Stictis urceolatum]|nr:hypothetical protein [Stictis urceolata]
MPLNIQSPTLARWIILALASGCFAALNGAFAKLTTTALTSTLSTSLSSLFHLSPTSFGAHLIEFTTRGFFFALNLISNAIMWALFTRALTAHPSATKVSLVNTSANFLLTAALGWIVFGEKLRGLWWLGAAFLVVGNLIIGRDRGEEGRVRLEGDGGTGAGGVGAVGADGDLRRRGEGEGEGEESVPLVEGDILAGNEEGVPADGESEDEGEGRK